MQKNIPKLYFFSFFSMFFVSLPIWVPYFQGHGFSMQEVFLVQGIFAFSVAALEVPSGYFCDLFGRRRTLIMGGIFYGLSFSWLAFATRLWETIVFEIGAAFAFSLISGADVALLYDSLEENVNREEKARVLGNVQFAQLISEAGGAILCGLLVVYGMDLPFKVQAIVSWFPLIIALGLVENKKMTLNPNSHKENFSLVLRHIFLQSSTLRRNFMALVIWGLSTFMAAWIYQKYWQSEQIPLSWFGYMWAGANLTAAISSKLASRLQKVTGQAVCLLIACSLPLLGYFGMGLGGGMAGVSAGFAIYVGRGLIQVIMREEFNHHIPNHFRATANSLHSFFFRGIFAFSGPLVGWAIDVYGVKVALVSLGVVFLLFYFLITIPEFLRLRLKTV